jgi:hypothetical protein
VLCHIVKLCHIDLSELKATVVIPVSVRTGVIKARQLNYFLFFNNRNGPFLKNKKVNVTAPAKIAPL